MPAIDRSFSDCRYKAGIAQGADATNAAYHQAEGATLGLTALTRYYNNPPAVAPGAIAEEKPGGYGGLGFSKRQPRDEQAIAEVFGAETVAMMRGEGPPPGPRGNPSAPPTGLNTGEYVLDRPLSMLSASYIHAGD